MRCHVCNKDATLMLESDRLDADTFVLVPPVSVCGSKKCEALAFAHKLAYLAHREMPLYFEVIFNVCQKSAIEYPNIFDEVFSELLDFHRTKEKHYLEMLSRHGMRVDQKTLAFNNLTIRRIVDHWESLKENEVCE